VFSEWVHFCVSWEVAWLRRWVGIQGVKCISVFPGKFHDWQGDLKMCPGCESISVFLGSCIIDEMTWKCVRMWVCLCVSWEAAWLTRWPENMSSLWVHLWVSWEVCMIDRVTWKCIQCVSPSLFPGKLRGWSGDLKMHQDVSPSLCFLGSCMTDVLTWKYAQVVSLSVFPRKLHDWWDDLKMCPGSKSISVFPGKLHDWWVDMKMPLAHESVFVFCMTDDRSWKST
jgi:hypothetical protein